MDLLIFTLNVTSTAKGAILQLYLPEDRRFLFLTHEYVREAIQG